MRVFSTLVASTFLAGFAAALPRPETDGAALLKRTDQQYGYSGSGSGSDSSYSGSGSGSGYSGSGSGYSGSGSGYSGSGSGYDSSSSSSSSSYGSSSTMMSDCSKDGSCNPSSTMDCSKDGSCNPSSTMMSDSTSTMMSDSTSTMMYDSSSAQYTSTSSTYTAQATSTMSYGSGSTNWGSSGYNDCVQQCIANYGPPPASYTPPTSTSGDSSGSSGGSGTTHTVIVAPTQGVLRYIPFAVNASVGDTVMFMWGANNHTVTKSSQLELCNKTDNQPFASGEQNKPFTFTQVVNDTNPIFFYCGTPGHCAKGMFGMINPPSAYMAPSSVGQMMGGAVANSSDMAAMMAYTDKMTNGSDKAANWGMNIDMAQIDPQYHQVFLENVMYTRAFLGANREVLKDDGSIDLNSHGAPMQLPTDMASVNNAVDAQPNAQANAQANGATGAAASTASSAAASPTETGKTNGAASTVASSALLGVAAIAAAVLAL